jgi:signal transduction histidine kinase
LLITFGHIIDMTFVTSRDLSGDRLVSRVAGSQTLVLRLASMLDIRRSLAARIGWSIALTALLIATITGLYTMRVARAAIEREIGQLYNAHAQRLIDTIDTNLAGRGQWISATATFLATAGGAEPSQAHRQMLIDMRAALPEIEWAGITDLTGKVLIGSDGILEGASVANRPWFTSAFLGAYIGDVHPGLLLNRLLPPMLEGEPRRFVDLSAPIIDRTGELRGILGAALGWSWIEALRLNTATALAGRSAVEVLLLGVDGTVLLGSDKSPQGSRIDLSNLSFHGNLAVDDAHLIGLSRSRGFGAFKGLGWSVMVREPASEALAPAYSASLSLFGAIALGGLLSALASSFAVSRIMRRLKLLAQSADDLRLGHAETFLVPMGQDEAGRIGRSIKALIGTLQRANEDLIDLNQDLDQRVVARTRDIERMEQEARFTAVMRERLRISRDLHDTLAHSMLAMLTQIRLIRKLAVADPKRVKEELDSAEIAAKEGLDHAREAVLQLRYSPVRDDGLGAALERLVAKMKDRSETKIELEIDPYARSLADDRSATAYRIVEEAVRNAEKHAFPATITIYATLNQTETGRFLALSVVDDGIGFDPNLPKPGHFGLVGIHEQAELIEADICMESSPEHGTRMDLRVQLDGFT